MRFQVTLLCSAVGLVLGLVSCGDGIPDSPTEPTLASSDGLAVFTDPASGFSTSDVRDVDDQIVQFDLGQQALIWTPDSLAFDGYPVSGSFIGPAGEFQVQFGTVNGERRAYFTEVGPGTICDIRVDDGFLTILPTSAQVPHS